MPFLIIRPPLLVLGCLFGKQWGFAPSDQNHMVSFYEMEIELHLIASDLKQLLANVVWKLI